MLAVALNCVIATHNCDKGSLLHTTTHRGSNNEWHRSREQVAEFLNYDLQNEQVYAHIVVTPL